MFEPRAVTSAVNNEEISPRYSQMESTVVGSVATESNVNGGQYDLTVSFVREKLEDAGVFANIQDRWDTSASLHEERDGYATFQKFLEGLAAPDVPQRIGDMQEFERYILRELVADRLRGFGDLGMEIRKLGQGKFGRVFLHLFTRAHEDPLYPINRGTLCAVKELIRSEHAARFEREILLMRKLSETGITPHFLGSGVTEVNREFHPWFAMEYVRGRDMRCLLQARPGEGAPPNLVADILVILLRYIRELSRQGVVHRDLKPENILLEDDGRLRLLDLGLAVAPEGESPRITAEGQAAGTPAYAAPEMILGKFADVSSSADLYSAGAIGYHLLTGRAPCAGMNNAQIAVHHNQKGTPDFRCIPQSCPAELEIILRELLSHDPATRGDPGDAMLRLIERGGSSLQPLNGDFGEFPDSHPGALKIKMPPHKKGELFPTSDNDLHLVAAITDSYASLSSDVPPVKITLPRSTVRTALYGVAALGGIVAAGAAFQYSWKGNPDARAKPPASPKDSSKSFVSSTTPNRQSFVESNKALKPSVRFEVHENEGCTLTIEGGRKIHFSSEELLPLYAGKKVSGAGFMCSDSQVREILGIDPDAPIPKKFEGMSARMGWILERNGKHIVMFGSAAVVLQQERQLALYRDPALAKDHPKFMSGSVAIAKVNGTYKAWTQDPLAADTLQGLAPTSAQKPWITTVGKMPKSWKIKSEAGWLSTVNGSIGLWQEQIEGQKKAAAE